MAAPKLPQQFGPYTLQELIARGGMAEIFRATASGVGGFEKTVAIKKILPHLAENDEYMTMLIDEARIIVSINHANIAQVYDLGEIDGDYYIAMEYIHGADLSTMVKELKESNRTVPVEHALFITSGIAAGLHVAHNKCDDSGRPINIVHRDVSPHNILISFAGDVKIIDFGVAKARGKEAHTQLGVIKGKLLYMAPEQAMAKDLDGRADLFAMGLILYRMLTNHLPFEGDNEFQIYNHILSKEIPPPRAFNPNIPEEVNQITMMLLQRDPSKRYQDGYSAKVDLDRALQTVAPGYSISRLSRWVESDFSHLIQQRQRSHSGQNDIAPSTPSHNQVHTGDHDSSWQPESNWEPGWDEIDENEDTVNVALDSPEAVEVMRRAQADREKYLEMRASGALPAPAAAPWAAAPGPQPGQVPAPQQSGQWNQPPPPQQQPPLPPQPQPVANVTPQPVANVPPQFAGHDQGQWNQPPGPMGSGQYPAPNQSGQFNNPYPGQSGAYPVPGAYPGPSTQFPAQQSGVFPNSSGQFAAPSQSGMYAPPNPSGYFAQPGASGVYNHYETFQPGANPEPEPEEVPNKRLLAAVGVLLVLSVAVGLLAWELYVEPGTEVPQNNSIPVGTNGATAGAVGATGTTGIAVGTDPEVVEAQPDAGAVVDSPDPNARTVRLRVDTTPPGVDVYVSDKLIGQTPLDEPIPWGEKEVPIRFELIGFETKELQAIPFDDVRRKHEMTPISGSGADAGVADTADVGGAVGDSAKAVEKEEPPKPEPKPKPKKRKKKRRTTTKKPAKKDPSVPLLLDAPKEKSDVPVF